PLGSSSWFVFWNDTTRAWEDACRFWASFTILRISKSNWAANCSRIARTSSTIGSRAMLTPHEFLGRANHRARKSTLRANRLYLFDDLCISDVGTVPC